MMNVIKAFKIKLVDDMLWDTEISVNSSSVISMFHNNFIH